MRIFIFLSLLLLCLQAQNYRVVSFYTDFNTKPFAYEEDGDKKGIYIDIIKEAIKKVGTYRHDFKDTSVKRGLERLYADEILALVVENKNLPQKEKERLKAYHHIPIKHTFVLDEKTMLLDLSIYFSKKPFLYQKDFTTYFNLAINIMKNSGQIQEIYEVYLDNKNKKRIPIVLYEWGYFVSSEVDGYGIIAELLALIWENAGYKVDFQFQTPHYGYLLTKWGNALLTTPSYKDEEKAKYMYFSDPLITVPLNLFYKHENFPNGITKGLENYKIGAISSFYYAQSLKKKNLNVVYFDTEHEMYQSLIQNNIDLLISSKYIFNETLLNYTHNTSDYRMYEKKLFLEDRPIHVVFSKNYYKSKYLLEQFNKSFAEIKHNGKLTAVLQKFEIDESVYKATFGKAEDYKPKVAKPNIFKFSD